MSTTFPIDKTRAYLGAEFVEPHLDRDSEQDGPFVTIARDSGVRGTTFAHLLAERLDKEIPGRNPWTVFNGNLIDSMLTSEHLDPRLARFLPEDHVSEIRASIGELVGLHPNLWQLTERVKELTRKLARNGRIILVGRGANFACAGVPNGIHIRLVAPVDYRAVNTAESRRVELAEAKDFNDKVGSARERYVETVYGADIKDVLGYDLTLNAGSLPLGTQIELVMLIARARFAVKESLSR